MSIGITLAQDWDDALAAINRNSDQGNPIARERSEAIE
jgi:hypothetical protein